jgi:hypothetical protein
VRHLPLLESVGLWLDWEHQKRQRRLLSRSMTDVVSTPLRSQLTHLALHHSQKKKKRADGRRAEVDKLPWYGDTQKINLFRAINCQTVKRPRVRHTWSSREHNVAVLGHANLAEITTSHHHPPLPCPLVRPGVERYQRSGPRHGTTVPRKSEDCGDPKSKQFAKGPRHRCLWLGAGLLTRFQIFPVPPSTVDALRQLLLQSGQSFPNLLLPPLPSRSYYLYLLRSLISLLSPSVRIASASSVPVSNPPEHHNGCTEEPFHKRPRLAQAS